MLLSRYVLLVERERLLHDYLDLRKGTESVMEITKMFTEKAMFCPEFAIFEQAHMIRHFSMIKTDIRQFWIH